MQVPILSQLLSHHATASASAALKKQAAVKAQDSSSDTGNTSGSTSAAGSAEITANDFLSLLVTEIQNQDPTTQTDPMQYITQLCDVNSLEQLVQINQNTTPPTTSTTSNSSIASSAAAIKAHSATSAAAAKSASALLPLGSQSRLSGSAAQAVAQSLGRSAPVASQAIPSQLPSTHIAMRPEELRAIEMSIPGAALAGGNTPATLIPTSPAGVSGGDIR